MSVTRYKWMMAILLASLTFVGGVVSLAFQAFLHPPEFELMKSEIEVKMKRADGSEGTRLVGPRNSDWIPISQVSNMLLSAIISSEDTSFYSHSGVDVFEIKESIKKDWKEKKWARGGSTITQQVIKNTFLTSEKTIWRKIKEIVYAHQLEKVLKKSQILEFYINLVEWGPGLYGIRQAAQTYFGKSPSDLSAKESAFLALLLPAPRKYFVYFKNKELTKWAGGRLDRILFVMHSMGFLADEEYELARNENLWGKSNYTSNSEKEVEDSVNPETFKVPPQAVEAEETISNEEKPEVDE